jgi:hypothetical protein
MRFVSGTTDKRRGIEDRPQTLNLLHWYQSRWSLIAGVVDPLRTLHHRRCRSAAHQGLESEGFGRPPSSSAERAESVVHSAAAAFAVKFRCNSKSIQAAPLRIPVHRALEAKHISWISCLAGTRRRRHESNHPDRSPPKVAPRLRSRRSLKKRASRTSVRGTPLCREAVPGRGSLPIKSTRPQSPLPRATGSESAGHDRTYCEPATVVS